MNAFTPLFVRNTNFPGLSPFLASAELGHQIAVLLDTERPVRGATTGQLRAELKPIANPLHHKYLQFCT